MTRWLILAFVTVPLVEIFVIVQVGQVIGGWWTVALLFAMSVLGGWLVRREGRQVWLTLVDAMGSGRLPTRELLDAAIVLIGGTLLLTPGFVSDVVGVLMLIPVTRPMWRRLVESLVSRRILAGAAGPWSLHDPRDKARGPVIPGEVVEDDDNPPR